jgi:polyhydroxyalkanoate synthesis regulator phasin
MSPKVLDNKQLTEKLTELEKRVAKLEKRLK